MSAEQPNIVVFFWDNLGWGEVGCYGGGILRGAPTPRIDRSGHAESDRTTQRKPMWPVDVSTASP